MYIKETGLENPEIDLHMYATEVFCKNSRQFNE
jgi:hypothetical protein